MPLDAGVRLGPYELLDLLGAGGMGEVYCARDTRLDRFVALKLLPAAFAGDDERRQRFAREARAIAALNHPHICTLYAFERIPVADGPDVDVLVLEYLEGETLAARLQRGAARRLASGAAREASPSGPRPARALPLAEALAVAIQIAEGLAAAHKQGIVHRDLKPGNVMLTRGSSAGATAPQVKLLDFGLAKLGGLKAGPVSLSEATATAHEPLTGDGAIVGTLAYMAPEQLEGRAVDARTDLFALGAIVYEMVTGHRAFEGDSEAGLIAAILEHEPVPLRERAPLAPPALERVVRKCLAKDPDARWESAHDLADELRWMLEDSGVRAPGPAPARPRRSVARVAAAVAAVAIGGTAAWWLLGPPPAALMRTIPLTSYPGEELYPALSPDGEQVAFTWRGPTGDGPFKLYVKLVDGGDPLLIHEGSSDVFTPTWSPDGRRIAFVQHVEAAEGEPADGVFVASALGGAARRLGVFRMGRHGLSWSPDGERLALPHRESPEGPTAILLFDLPTGRTERLTEPPAGFMGDSAPRFSPDGRTLAFMRVRMISQEEIYAVPVAGGEPRRLTVNGSNMRGLDWTADGQALVFSALIAGRPTSSGLWRVPVAGGQAEPLEVGEVAQFPSVSARGRRLAYAHRVENWDIWRMPGPASESGPTVPERWMSSTSGDYFPVYSPSGQHVAFTSHRSGHGEIWTAASDGTRTRQLTFLQQYGGDPRWSPDGTQMVFSSQVDDNRDIFVVGVTGGIPRRITTDPSNEVGGSWSRDGRWIYFRSDRTGRYEVWKVSVKGGVPTQVTRQIASVAHESPDGRFLYYTKSDVQRGPSGLWRMPVGGGPEERVLDHSRAYMWTMFNGGICYLNEDGPQATLDCYDFASGAITELARFEGTVPGLGISVSPDGRWLLYNLYEVESDLMLVENFR